MKTLSKSQINALADKYVEEMRAKRSALREALLEKQLDEAEAVINAAPNADVLKQLISGEYGNLEWWKKYTRGFPGADNLIKLLGVSLSSAIIKAKIEFEALPSIPSTHTVINEITLATIDATSIDDIMAMLSAKFE